MHSHLSLLQHTAAHCNMLQHTATHTQNILRSHPFLMFTNQLAVLFIPTFDTLQHITTHCNTSATHCKTPAKHDAYIWGGYEVGIWGGYAKHDARTNSRSSSFPHLTKHPQNMMHTHLICMHPQIHELTRDPLHPHISQTIFYMMHTHLIPSLARCSTLQHTATCCNTLQHICNKLQHTRKKWCTAIFSSSSRTNSRSSLFPYLTRCNTLQHTYHTATHCNTLQHTATHCNTLQRTCNTLTKHAVYPSFSEVHQLSRGPLHSHI